MSRGDASFSQDASERPVQPPEWTLGPDLVSEDQDDGKPAFYGENVAAKMAQVPERYRGIYRKAMRGRSMKAAIHAQCLECVGWQREEVRKCADPACSLYPYRPYR